MKLKTKTLQILVFMEETRLANAPDSQDDGESDAFEAGVDDVCHEEKPPTPQDIYNVLFEKIEGEPIHKVISISRDDPWYLRAVLFLGERVKEELKEVTEYTSKAQNLYPSVSMNISRDQQIILDHQNGEKLAKLLDFVKKKFVKRFVRQFGRKIKVPSVIEGIPLDHFDRKYVNKDLPEIEIIDDEPVAKAEKVLSEVRSTQRNALLIIIGILRPVLPTYGLAMLFMFLSRAFEAPLWAQSLPSYQSSITKINMNATVGEFGFAPDVLESAKGHAFLFIVGFLFSRPIDVLASSFEQKATRDFSGPLRTAVLNAIMKQDTEYFDSNPSATLQDRLNSDTDKLVRNILHLPLETMGIVFRVIQHTVTLYFVAPTMLWSCLSFNVPAFCVIAFVSSGLLKRLYGKLDRSEENASTNTLELLEKVRTVRQFSMEKEETHKYTLNNATRNIFESRIEAIESLTHEMSFIAHMIGEMYVTYIALMLAVDGQASVVDAVVASTIGMWLQNDVNQLLEKVPEILKFTKPLHRVSALLACKARIEKNPEDPNLELLRPERFRGHIEFRDVKFSYPTERQTVVLNGFSFTAEPGQKIALVGKAGCGKSTTVDLLQRFYDRTSGEILVDGHPIEKYDINIIRKHSGIVAQSNVLFDRSLYDNIVYGMKDPPHPESEEFKKVCVQAQAWEFVQKFPKKQYTILGEEGIKLSGGQRQRIAIARVIIRQPVFLFLDEATSSLDAINEKAVQAALDEMLRMSNGVAVVVAHRLTTICNCDKIVVMGDNGTKIEEGTHEELLQAPKQLDEDGEPIVGPGLYHTLWDTQQVEGKSKDNIALKNLVTKQEDQIEVQRKEIEELKKKIYPSYPGLYRYMSAPSGGKGRCKSASDIIFT